MQKPVDFRVVTIPAGTATSPGSRTEQLPGTFFLCRGSSAPFQMQFDAGTPFYCEAGFQIGGRGVTPPVKFQSLTFLNFNAYAVTVRFYVGGEQTAFSGTILNQNLDTYLFGNLGLSANGTYNGQSITFGFTGTNYISIAGGASLTVLGVNNGNKRKLISIFNGNVAKNYLLIRDSQGRNFTGVMQQTTMVYETNDTIILKPDGSLGSDVIIGEIYYAA